MLPRLDSRMGQVVICARVAYQLTKQLYDYDLPTPLARASYARQSARNLPPDYPGMLRFALHSLAVYCDLGMKPQVWLSSVLEAAHDSQNFRRCFFFDYKAERRPYPRVTNRGVQDSPKGRKSRMRRA